MTRKIARYCDIVMELGWLLAITTVPLYFNIYTSRVFEPDKITILRSFAVIMAAVWLVKGLSSWAADRDTLEQTRTANNRRASRERETVSVFIPDGDFVPLDQRPFLDRFLRRPLMAPAMFLVFVYLLATILSVVPGISWWGSYQRLQGTYTFYSYVTLFLVLVFNLKERRQLERIISFILLINVPITVYGILQHNNADPLPWQGDTTLRVTSTMGNAIFIAAYLIMCVPFALYRGITTGAWLWSNRGTARRSMTSRNRDTALSWVLLYAFFTIFQLGLFFAILQFNASYHPDQAQTAQPTSTAGVAGAAGLVKDNSTLNSQGSGIVGPWWALPLGLLVVFALYFIFTVRRQGTDNNYLFRIFEFVSYITIFLLQFLVIVYSQSRGPEAGLIAGLFLIAPLLFWRRKMWRWLGGWIGAGVVIGGFLLLFNMPSGSTPLEPIFSVLRQNKEIARFSQLTQINDGTGKVRELIWKGDFGIISNAAQHDPLRLLIGYGPESLYQISPTQYQPDLAHIEARNAIPDRSHNGYLDSIMTTGFVGLLAYIAFVVMFVYYCIRFMFKTNRLEYQVLLACLASIMVAHQIEIQVGIQIVSTWTMFWLAAAMLVLVSGLIRGSWNKQTTALEAQPANSPVELKESLPPVEAIPELEPVGAGMGAGRNVQLNAYGKPRSKPNRVKVAPVVAEVAASVSAKNGNGKARNNDVSARVNGNGNGSGNGNGNGNGKTNGVRNGRAAYPAANANGKSGLPRFGGASFASGYPDTTPTMQVRPWFWGLLALVVIVVGWYIYISNFIPIQGDVIYKEAQNYTQIKQADKSLPYYREAVQIEPNEDFYRLYLGESYLEKAQTDANNPQTAAQATQEFELSHEQLVKAHELAPLNADHLANLGRLYSVWSAHDPNLKDGLSTSIDWFKQAMVRAPNNAHLYDELSQVYLRANQPNDAVEAAKHSVSLDQQYDENRVALGNAYLAIQDKTNAGKQFAEAIKLNPKSLDDVDYVKRMEAIGTTPEVKTEDLIKALTPIATTSADDRSYYNVSQGIIYFYRSDMSKAESLLTQVLSATQAQNSGQPQQGQQQAQSQQAAYNFYAHLYLAQVYAATGRAPLAETEAQTALSIVNSSPGGKPLVEIAQNVLNKVKAIAQPK